MEDTLTDTPHSLLDAAKITARAAYVEWATAHRYYRDLQGDPDRDPVVWLPKSLGRNIWAAHPHYIARLLIALGSASIPSDAAKSVTAIAAMTPDGRKRHIVEDDVYFVERAITSLLVDPEKLAKLDRIEFDPADGEVQIIYQDETVDRFAQPGATRNWQRGFYWRGVIRATVLSTIASEVRWRTYAESPINKVEDGGVDPEA